MLIRAINMVVINKKIMESAFELKKEERKMAKKIKLYDDRKSSLYRHQLLMLNEHDE